MFFCKHIFVQQPFHTKKQMHKQNVELRWGRKCTVETIINFPVEGNKIIQFDVVQIFCILCFHCQVCESHRNQFSQCDRTGVPYIKVEIGPGLHPGTSVSFMPPAQNCMRCICTGMSYLSLGHLCTAFTS